MALLGVVLIFGGCGYVITVESGGGCPGGVIYEDPVIEATIAEIDAISKLDFEPNKADGLKQIASRETLCPPCQEYLVGAVFRNLHFEPSKKDVLITLIRNRVFSFEAKRMILKNLEKLHFEPHKKEILDEINRRGPLIPVTEEVIVVAP